MAQVRKYSVSFNPTTCEVYPATERSPEYKAYVTSFTFQSEGAFMRPDPFEACGIPDLLAKVEALANEVPFGVSAYVRVADGRPKPAGFATATRGLYYSVQEVIKGA